MAADAAVKNYCKRAFETNLYTWYPPETRLGGEAIVVEETPVLYYVMSGTVTQGAAQITNLSSTTNLLVGMPTLLTTGVNNQTVQPFPNGATIQSIDSDSQVTMTGNATYSVSGASFSFGLALWFDPNGSFSAGQGTDPSGPYGPTTLLYQGIDYAVQRDAPDNTCRSGKLVRLNSAFGFLGMGGAWNPYGSSWGGLNMRGTLTAPLKPLWPNWPPGSFKVVYAAGYGTGATAPDGLMPANTTIPQDLTIATTFLAAYMFNNADTGMVQITHESFQGYDRQLLNNTMYGTLKQVPELGSVRQLLSRWRRRAI